MTLNLLAALSIATVCVAQNESQIAVLQESLAQSRAERAEYTDRIGKLAVQLKIADAEIEGSIAKTLEFAQRYTDSAETRERLMKSKASMIKDLINSIDRYSGLQRDITREIATERDYVKEDMIQLRDWANEKISVRVKQITEITTSLGGYDFYSRGVAYDDNNYDYEREKRVAENAVENKTDIILKMRKGIKELTAQSQALQKELSNVRSQRSVEDINYELNAINDKIILLENSVEEIFAAEAYGERVGKNASREIEKELRNRVNEIKSDSDSFFKNFDALIRLLRTQKSMDITIEKYEFAIEQLKSE